jgi:hypothetical protein
MMHEAWIWATSPIVGDAAWIVKIAMASLGCFAVGYMYGYAAGSNRGD